MSDYPTWKEVEFMIDKRREDVCNRMFAPARSWVSVTLFITILGMFATAAAFLIGTDRDNREAIAVNREIDKGQAEQIRELRLEMADLRRDNKVLLEELIRQVNDLKLEFRRYD